MRAWPKIDRMEKSRIVPTVIEDRQVNVALTIYSGAFPWSARLQSLFLRIRRPSFLIDCQPPSLGDHDARSSHMGAADVTVKCGPLVKQLREADIFEPILRAALATQE